MNKYVKLWRWFIDKNEDEIVLSFDEIKNIAEIDINHSFLTYKKELIDYGYKVDKILIKNKHIRFCKLN